ncbi:MAG: hypothetical protein IIV41_06700, partial [Akkermansia sp.]|nr:hypothetical protein [Akkermansia sp.]
KRGGNRQELHEIVRICSMNATAKMKNGEQWDLLADLSSHPEFGIRQGADAMQCAHECQVCDILHGGQRQFHAPMLSRARVLGKWLKDENIEPFAE